MNAEPRRPEPADGPAVSRIFLHEPGWRIEHKIGSTREFCYTMSPGQDFYHRLYDGEVYLQRGDGEERLCLTCASRRGLISFAPRGLREPLATLFFEVEEGGSEIDVVPPDTTGWSD
jgi:hypothetical protein